MLSHSASADHDSLELVRNEMTRLEAKFATHAPGSVIERLNRAAGTGDSGSVKCCGHRGELPDRLQRGQYRPPQDRAGGAALAGQAGLALAGS